LADQTTHLPEDLAQRVTDVALEKAPAQTTGQLRAGIQRLIISLDPASAKDRYEKKLTERMVICEPTDAGTANIHGLDLPADQANQAMCRINRLAYKANRKGDRRGIDQIRADIFLDLLTGNHFADSGSDHGRKTALREVLESVIVRPRTGSNKAHDRIEVRFRH
jgi:hypothetical protein